MGKLFISCTHRNNFYWSIMLNTFNLIKHLYHHITVQEKQNHPATQAVCPLSIQTKEVFARSLPPTTTCILRTKGAELGSTTSGSRGCLERERPRSSTSGPTLSRSRPQGNKLREETRSVFQASFQHPISFFPLPCIITSFTSSSASSSWAAFLFL